MDITSTGIGNVQSPVGSPGLGMHLLGIVLVCRFWSPLKVLCGSFRNESGGLCNNTLKHEEFYLYVTEIVVSLSDKLGTHYLLSGLLLIANKSVTYY